MKKFFRRLALILPVFIALSGCSKSSQVNDEKVEKQTVRKASKEVAFCQSFQQKNLLLRSSLGLLKVYQM